MSAAVDGDPIRVSVRHCVACQLRTRSAFGVQARFARERVTVSGTWQEYVSASDGDGQPRRFRFCARCGATVFDDYGADSDVVAIPVGAFADRGFPAPARSIYESRRHPWVTIVAEAVERHA